jgi:hypothetical protein
MMVFKIVTMINRKADSVQTLGDIAAADAIENWSSRFTDRPRTKYGMKITTQYVRGLTVGEVGNFKQPNESFIIERMA